MTVLLVGNNDSSALAACRSLGINGINVGIAPIGEWGVAHRSRHCRAIHEVGDPAHEVRQVCDSLAEVIIEHNYEVVIPLSDAATLLCQELRDRVPARVALPNKEAFAHSHDNKKLQGLCAELHIPVPVETKIEAQESILKPVHAAMIHGNRLLHFPTKRARSREAAVSFLRECSGVVEVMVQEPSLEGASEVHLLAKRGRVLTMVQQNRGAGSYGVTVPLDPELKGYARRLIGSLKWSGVATLEFKGTSGRWQMTGLGCRFWESLALTTAAGGDFAVWLVEMYLGKEPSFHPIHYGISRRHLGKDLGRAVKRGHMMGWIKDLVRRRAPPEVESMDDPVPGLAYWTAASRCIGNWMNRRVEFAPYRNAENEQRNLIVENLRADSHVLFVCRGNTCRSPFAENYCRQKLGWKHVRSCGTFPVPHRRVSETAEVVARVEFGVELSDHDSTALSDMELRWADVIVVMDRRQLVDLSGRVKGQMILLCEGQEVHDPYGKDAAAYGECYQQISAALDKLCRHIRVPVSA